jgi:hypothetical protein
MACRIRTAFNPDDVRYADAVAIGRIVDYRIISEPSEADRRMRRRIIADPQTSPELRRSLRHSGYLTDYARFTVVVDEVLLGHVGPRVTVTWDNSTFDEPASMPAGQFLIALRDPNGAAPPLRGPSATILPVPEPRTLTVLQAPCAPAFIFERSSAEAEAVRRRLGNGPSASPARR